MDERGQKQAPVGAENQLVSTVKYALVWAVRSLHELACALMRTYSILWGLSTYLKTNAIHHLPWLSLGRMVD